MLGRALLVQGFGVRGEGLGLRVLNSQKYVMQWPVGLSFKVSGYWFTYFRGPGTQQRSVWTTLLTEGTAKGYKLLILMLMVGWLVAESLLFSWSRLSYGNLNPNPLNPPFRSRGGALSFRHCPARQGDND